MSYPILKGVRSRELRGSILFTDCHCLRRNGLQNDCRRGGCQGTPECTELPYANCVPAKAACVRHCANPYASHLCAVCPSEFRTNNKTEESSKKIHSSYNSKVSLAGSEKTVYNKNIKLCKWEAPCEAHCYNETTAAIPSDHGYCAYTPYTNITTFKHGFIQYYFCPICYKRYCRIIPQRYCRCSPCGPMVCYKYEDCGPALQCLPVSAFKRNGLQDCQFFQQGSIRYLCRAGDSCCPPACPPCVRRPPPGKTNDSEHADRNVNNGGNGHEKSKEKENPLKKVKSRELRGGIMYNSCDCIKRNGLQHDCRRTGCGGEPTCSVLPDPLCGPSQLARMRGLADPSVLAAHVDGKNSSGSPADPSTSSGKRKIIVCELKGIIPDSNPKAKDGKTKCCCDLGAADFEKV